MKTLIISVSTFVVMLISCGTPANKEYTPEGMRKLSNAEVIERLKAKDLLNPQELEFQSTDGVVLKEDSVRTLFISGTTYGDQYVDKDGKVKVMILREMTEEDKAFLEELSAVQKMMMENESHEGHNHEGHNHDH